MKIAKVRELDANEIAKQREEADEQLFRLRLQISMGQPDGLKKYRALRKARARMLTVLRERELGTSPAPAAAAASAGKPAAKPAKAAKKAAPKAAVKKAAAKPAKAPAKKAAKPAAKKKTAAKESK